MNPSVTKGVFDVTASRQEFIGLVMTILQNLSASPIRRVTKLDVQRGITQHLVALEVLQERAMTTGKKSSEQPNRLVVTKVVGGFVPGGYKHTPEKTDLVTITTQPTDLSKCSWKVERVLPTARASGKGNKVVTRFMKPGQTRGRVLDMFLLRED